MTGSIISLRPHHIDRFVSYYHKFSNIFEDPRLEKDYGEKFTKKLRVLFDHIASGGGKDEYILVKNGVDHICSMCPPIAKRETCKNPDSLSLWNGSGQVMKEMDLKEGFLYPIGEFMEKVKQLYPDRNLT